MRGLYIHIPFCVQKCRYCDFVSFAGREAEQEKYINMLGREMEKYCGEKIDTVFIGGGTPTVLSVQSLSRLFDKIHAVFSLSDDCEFSVEANPKTVDADKARCLADGGVNRVSVGVQSFDDTELAALGRIHTAEAAHNTIDILHKHGFRNINIDLMSGIPNQTIETFQKTLVEAVSCAPTHISCYSLIVEEGTPFYQMQQAGQLPLPDEKTDRAMYDYARDYLGQNGFYQYEISNFAKNGFECRHNFKYWDCEEYIGVGAAAHSYINDTRFCNTCELAAYLSGQFHLSEQQRLTRNDKIEEFMFLGLRTRRGISEQEFFKRFGISVTQVYAKPLEKFLLSGHLLHEDGYYRLSADAISVSNQILCEFIL